MKINLIFHALWFDALLKWEPIKNRIIKIISLLWFDALLKWEPISAPREACAEGLWFDALLKWEPMRPRFRQRPKALWFDALLKWEPICLVRLETSSGCDLMPYWNENQSDPTHVEARSVVIWCLIEMRTNTPWQNGNSAMLWFDALLKWEPIRNRFWPTSRRCDLMPYWNENQYVKPKSRLFSGCDLMPYWNENQCERIADRLGMLWFDALLKWEPIRS